MDPFGSHIQSMAASLQAAESPAHVRPWPAFKTCTDRRERGWGGGQGIISLLHHVDVIVWIIYTRLRPAGE